MLEKYKEDCEKASQTLRDSIDKEVKLIRLRKDIDGASKQQQVNYANDMKAKFELHGYVPMAPYLRNHTIDYLNSLIKARQDARDAYSKAINLAAKSKEEEKAEDLLNELDRLTEPPVISRWDCVSGKHKWMWTLLADGSIQTQGNANANWKFKKDKLVIARENEFWVLEVTSAGTQMKAVNKNKTRFHASISYPRKNP
ncbi:MAG: hypothetical protein R3C11_12945 [Planctomycetaceae bacterium]